MKNYILTILGLIVILSACSPRLTPFTEELNESYNWSESELQQIQFYLSNDIVLYRENGNEESIIKNGKIKIREGRKIEKLIFKKGTPGVLLFTPKSDRFAVSFEQGDGSDRYLMFGPSDKANGRFVLLAKNWNKHKGKISYDNAIYSTPSSSSYASLMVDLKSARKISFRTERADGRVVE